MPNGNKIYGWDDDPSQRPDQPSSDPPHDAACLYCGHAITDDDIRTHSMMMQGPQYAKRSYFYRTHRTCDERAAGESIDAVVWSMIERNGD